MSRVPQDKLNQAIARFGECDFGGAERLCGEILRENPRNAEALHLLGVLKLQTGRSREAVALLGQALKLRHDDGAILENLGLAHLTAQDYAAAEAACRRAIELGAARGSVYMRLGLALGLQGKITEAESALRTAAGRAPADPDIHLNLGNNLAQQGRAEEAFACFRKVLALQPNHVDAHFNIGTLLKDLGRFDEAVTAYRETLALHPDYADAHNNLGVVYEQMGRLDDAIEHYRRVLVLDPHSADAHCNLSSAYRMQGRLDEAAVHGERALAIRPDFVAALMNLANVRVQQCRFADARACYLKALAIEPRNAELQFTYGTLCLELGEFDQGWQGYRWRPTRLRALGAGLAVDEALAGEVAGRIVLLLGEQGLGDELFFLRFAANLRELGAVLICECDSRLRNLLERTGIFDRVIAPNEPKPRHDLAFLTGDLPRVLLEAGQRAAPLQPVPRSLRLSALAVRAAAMRERLARLGPPPYVGLTWRAGTPPEAQPRGQGRVLYKEVPLTLLARVLDGVPGTLLVLQRHPPPGESEMLGKDLGRDVHDVSDANQDLEDMLALLDCIDEYVGVSNTNMHLMAGLGKRARVLVPYPAEWRWMAQGDESPWFPGFFIYRQETNRDWSPALAHLRDDLRRA